MYIVFAISKYLSMNIRLFSILLFFVFYTNSFAQVKEKSSSPLYFRIFGSKEGFYSDRVKVIQQDKFGFLWIGTKEGLGKTETSLLISFNTTLVTLYNLHY